MIFALKEKDSDEMVFSDYLYRQFAAQTLTNPASLFGRRVSLLSVIQCNVRDSFEKEIYFYSFLL